MSRNQNNFYGETPCDECGGPTIDFPSGSIWCPAEDPHAGGHFVKRADGRAAAPVKRGRKQMTVIPSVTVSVPDSDDVVRHDPIHNL